MFEWLDSWYSMNIVGIHDMTMTVIGIGVILIILAVVIYLTVFHVE